MEMIQESFTSRDGDDILKRQPLQIHSRPDGTNRGKTAYSDDPALLLGVKHHTERRTVTMRRHKPVERLHVVTTTCDEDSGSRIASRKPAWMSSAIQPEIGQG